MSACPVAYCYWHARHGRCSGGLRPSLFSRTYISLGFVEAVLSESHWSYSHRITVVVIGAVHTPCEINMWIKSGVSGNVWNHCWSCAAAYSLVTRRRGQQTDSTAFWCDWSLEQPGYPPSIPVQVLRLRLSASQWSLLRPIHCQVTVCVIYS